MTIRVRDIGPEDRAWLLALNNGCVPAVSALTPDSLEALLVEAALGRSAVDAGEPLGALVAFLPGASYASLNYRWFSDQGRPFLYIDRIMVAEPARGRRIGAALYDDAAAWGRGRRVPRLACEVNEIPPNPRSLAFHERLGFRKIASLDHLDGKRVAMLELEL